MSEFKAGDWALLLVAVEHIAPGSAVELAYPLEADDIVDVVGLGHARVGEKSWAFLYGEQPGFCPERCLMPLKGDFQPEQQKAKEEVEQ